MLYFFKLDKVAPLTIAPAMNLGDIIPVMKTQELIHYNMPLTLLIAEVLNFMLGSMCFRLPAYMKEHQHRLIQNGYAEIEMEIQ